MARSIPLCCLWSHACPARPSANIKEGGNWLNQNKRPREIIQLMPEKTFLFRYIRKAALAQTECIYAAHD